jgi:hypothetical protein
MADAMLLTRRQQIEDHDLYHAVRTASTASFVHSAASIDAVADRIVCCSPTLT